MRTLHLVIMALVVALIALLLIFNAGYGTAVLHYGYFTFNNRNYQFTQVFTTQAQWQQGLMNSTNVTNSTFALFAFPSSSKHSFWMKNTYAPLDIFWVNNSKVVYIVANAQPCTTYDKYQTRCIIYTPNVSASYVIETMAGFTQRNNMTVGSAVAIHVS